MNGRHEKEVEEEEVYNICPAVTKKNNIVTSVHEDMGGLAMARDSLQESPCKRFDRINTRGKSRVSNSRRRALAGFCGLAFYSMFNNSQKVGGSR